MTQDSASANAGSDVPDGAIGEALTSSGAIAADAVSAEYKPTVTTLEWRSADTAGSISNLWECPTCGAVVVYGRTQDHTEWHDLIVIATEPPMVGLR